MAKQRSSEKNNIVLVGVLKDRRDLDILKRERWYRIPVKYAPVRGFQYLAFYQPSSAKAADGGPFSADAPRDKAAKSKSMAFESEGKCIRYYARVLGITRAPRRELFPRESAHLRASDPYIRIRIGKLWELSNPIRNTTLRPDPKLAHGAGPRRVSFGFTTLARLLASKNILELYGVTPTEEIVGSALHRAGIGAAPEHAISAGGRRYRLDFAVFCERGRIAIECDNKKAHSGAARKRRDRAKDAALRRAGWTVLRLREREIIFELGRCVKRIEKTIERLGGSCRGSLGGIIR